MAEEPTRKIGKRSTDKAVANQALAELERREVPDTAPVPETPPDLLPEAARRGFYFSVAMALLVPLGCGAMAALLIWTRYWPPLPGLLAGWLGWCVLAALLPLATRRNAALAATGALVGMPVLALTVAMNFRVVRVEGASMSPTFLPGDVLLIDLKGSPADFANPGHEIYVLDVPNEKHHPLVKRLVATPGQTLIVRDGRLYADGERVFPADDSLNAPRLDYRGHLQEGVKPQGYFFIGDNPADSRDSRAFGPVSAENIEGRVVWRLKGSRGFGRVE
ncbi:MAG: signal peptidase I [Planctomycetes bacterium]|nr:signal peptidase I [Planctomycetota bacterium]